MRSLLVVVPLALSMFADHASAQQPVAARPCLARDQSETAFIQQTARQYHPEALAPARERDSVLVAFVLDSTCQVVRHVVAKYGADSLVTTDSLVVTLFPEFRGADFKAGGIIALAMRTPGHPIIVWAVLKRA